MRTTEQKNRMIAEFMDVIKYRPYGDYVEINGDAYEVEDLNYHTSWDWLMPVVEAIYNTGLDEQNTNEISDVTHALLDVNINAVHEAVVQFIEMYNNQK